MDIGYYGYYHYHVFPEVRIGGVSFQGSCSILKMVNLHKVATMFDRNRMKCLRAMDMIIYWTCL